MVELLVAVGVPTEAAETDAEGMEHHASDATLETFARLLARSSRNASGWADRPSGGQLGGAGGVTPAQVKQL